MPEVAEVKGRVLTPRAADLPGLDPLSWLAGSAKGDRFYWKGRNGEEIAAWGTVLRLESLSQVEKCLEDPETFVLGAMSFDSAAGTWPGFPPFGLRVPRQVLLRSGSSTRLYLFAPADEFPKEISQPRQATATETTGFLRRADEPDEVGWHDGLLDILSRIERGDVEKIVPARRTRLEFPEKLDPWGIFRSLGKITPGCFHFALEGEMGCWLGASPEMLYSREGRQLRAEAVAGTRRRGADAEEDHALGEFLQNDHKESQEHAAVVGMIRRVLQELSGHVESASPRRLLKLARVQHLITEFAAELRPEMRDADILRTLHPTPATCGLPVEAARDWIRRHESFPRGYYAGPVGWMTRDRSCFTVGLRSGLVREKMIDLFAGAGIVRGSKPEREWKELDSKIGDWMALFQP